MEKKRNNFLDGLVLGAALGSAAVFLFGTKKGREVLKVLQEEGKERFSKLEGMFSEYQEAMGDSEDYFEDEIEELPAKVDEVKHTVKASSDKVKTSLRKKLFKGIKRK